MPHPIKPNVNVYKNQPGRIEDYRPGHSSISEKENKQVFFFYSFFFAEAFRFIYFSKNDINKCLMLVKFNRILFFIVNVFICIHDSFSFLYLYKHC